jgi:hypothetical protein
VHCGIHSSIFSLQPPLLLQDDNQGWGDSSVLWCMLGMCESLGSIHIIKKDVTTKTSPDIAKSLLGLGRVATGREALNIS